MTYRIYEKDLEKLYKIKVKKGKSPKLARYECEQMRKLIKQHGKNTRGRGFKWGNDAYMDYDEDGIMNAFDCRPLNSIFQDDKYFFDHNNIPYLGEDEYTKTIRYMTPDEFIALAKKTSPLGMDDELTDAQYEEKVIDKQKVGKYSDLFKKIKKKNQRFPTPFLVYKSSSDRPYRHEGRHRAVAFEKAFGSKKKIPVYIVRERGGF